MNNLARFLPSHCISTGFFSCSNLLNTEICLAVLSCVGIVPYTVITRYTEATCCSYVLCHIGKFTLSCSVCASATFCVLLIPRFAYIKGAQYYRNFGEFALGCTLTPDIVANSFNKNLKFLSYYSRIIILQLLPDTASIYCRIQVQYNRKIRDKFIIFLLKLLATISGDVGSNTRR